MIKKISLIICFMVITSSISFANEEKYGECFLTDIRAYINNQYIESWNIDSNTYINIEDLDLYGFDVRWNKELKEYNAVYDNHTANNHYILMQKSQRLFMNIDDGWYTKWIKRTEPGFYAGVSPHGDRVADVQTSKGTIVFEFQKSIDVKYINKSYIPIFYGNIDVSDNFNYEFTPEGNILKINIIKDDFVNFESKIDVFLLDGIKSTGGEILATPLRFSTYINKDLNTNNTKDKYAGDCFKIDITAVVNNWDANIYRLDSKNLICLDRLGALKWDEKTRSIKVEINKKQNLYGLAKPIYKGKYKDWILGTSPKMVRSKSDNGNNLVLISNEDRSIKIKFVKDILPECINSNYIKMYHGSSDQSEKFNYIYNEEENTLTLELNDTSRDVITPLGYLFDNNKVDGMDNMEGRNYDIYILEGLRTKEGEKLPETLRLTGGIIWGLKDGI